MQQVRLLYVMNIFIVYFLLILKASDVRLHYYSLYIISYSKTFFRGDEKCSIDYPS